MNNYFLSFKSMSGKSPVQGVEIKSAHLENVMMTWMEFEPGADLPEHSHPHEQISLIVEGKIEMTVGGLSRVLTRGDAAVVPPRVTHSAKVLDGPAVAVDAWYPVRDDYRMNS